MRQVICFHAPDEPYGFMSNWYLSSFESFGIIFSSMEQYLMYNKAKIFGDKEICEQILQTDNVGKIKSLGRCVKNYDDVIWNGYRQIVVYEGLKEKFRQNTEIKEMLLATGDAILAECAVQDKIWGIGLSMKDLRRFDIQQWEGKNLLGFTLMQVRDFFRS